MSAAKKEIQDTLILMGFPHKYITRAFKVYEKQYGYSYLISAILEIIIRLQNKDKQKHQRKASKKIIKKNIQDTNPRNSPRNVSNNNNPKNNSNNNNINIEKGEYIDNNPIHRHPGWKSAHKKLVTECKSEIMKNIRNEIQALHWKLSEIFKNNAIYSCFAAEIYADLLKVGDVKQECEDFMNNNRIYFGYIKCTESKFIALSGLYNVRIRIFAYDNIIKKLFVCDKYGDNLCEDTVNVPLILLIKCRNDKEEYCVIEDPQSRHKRPLIRNILQNNQNTNNSKKRKLKDCNLYPPKKRKLSHNNSNNMEYKDDVSVLKQENEALRKRLDLFEMQSDKICVMNLNELNDIKHTFQSKIKLIEEAEKQLIDNRYNCVACMDKPKNISFVDGCSHMALCDKCEASLQIKKCPICQKPYKNVKKIDF